MSAAFFYLFRRHISTLSSISTILAGTQKYSSHSPGTQRRQTANKKEAHEFGNLYVLKSTKRSPYNTYIAHFCETYRQPHIGLDLVFSAWFPHRTCHAFTYIPSSFLEQTHEIVVGFILEELRHVKVRLFTHKCCRRRSEDSGVRAPPHVLLLFR